MLKSHALSMTFVLLSSTIVSCSKVSTSQTNSFSESYKPNAVELGLLFKGFDPENTNDLKKVCIDQNVEMESRPTRSSIYFSGLVKNSSEIARNMGVDLERLPSISLPNRFSKDNTLQARIDFVQSLSIDVSHVYYLTSIDISSYLIMSRSERLSLDSLKVVSSAAFLDQCGTHFVSGLTYGGLLSVLYDFEVPAGADPKQFSLIVQNHFMNNTTSEFFAQSKPNYRLVQFGGMSLDADTDPEALAQKFKNFPVEVESSPVVMLQSLTSYELLLNYPWE